ncbi:outer envelope protein 61-like [Telopea speciosissima]|uniref:outer envelope protein 61-like n=1 Tax=Telopea speciosissima TaxID=54955 RepID=UPI001CC62C47|nr:outer envelope protein 61-like [Telopea speciosissima]
MYNGMMDPELIRIAQEQMSRISPSELAKIQQQMMSNPELVKMATESMKNMRPEDLRNAAEQLKYARTEDMIDMGSKMANASPEEMATMRARADAQIKYELNGAQMLKKQGNELHSQGKFSAATEKYLLAKNNLKGIPDSRGSALRLACSLNLMSCYLKMKQYDDCVEEGSEVMAYDADNVKALYRRGQAYKELGQLEDAVSDLKKAHAISPHDETIAGALSDAEEKLAKEGGGQRRAGRLVIEEITEEEVRTVPAESHKSSTSTEYSVIQSLDAGECSQSQSVSNFSGRTTEAECLQGLKDDPEAIRSFQNFISNTNPETLAGLSAGGVPPDMLKSASSMIGKMSPEELQKMLHMASSFQGTSSYFPGGTTENQGDSSRSGSFPPDVSPDMLKTATDLMSKMSPEEVQNMFEVAASLRGKDSVSTAKAVDTNGRRSENGSKFSKANGISAINGNSDVGESSSRQLHANSKMGSSPLLNFPNSTADLQEQMRNQMNDPAMRQIFTSMIKNMSPETMASMSEQFGVKLSREDAERAQQAMSSLSPENLDRMMRWADRVQRGVEGAKKTKNWLLGRQGMILAICMLILAIVLHWLGFIGS